ncbi:nudix hydrolase [Roseibium sp. TrichSKD4]|uniref:DUF429 domain-containing protein n=1 Tax=Roseibium sp. TrichSKD4 TaxID=744980 RepID=UPI0001E5647C|nr:DUF429 domain-containing protein [Roseibium sp. TrichSKD4]EFO33359.1 nudix hydrolase [Roseibium sp. TrichSKD4]
MPEGGSQSEHPWVTGVDGCKAGWIAYMRQIGITGTEQVAVFPDFAALLSHVPHLSIIAVDMPIGLPDRVGLGGRGPEQAARKHLGMRQSSVFSVPSRSAVYAEEYAEACARALESSDPPRKVSKQCFYLFPKIREIDGLMSPDLEARVFEVHPELAFWRLNCEREMGLPKKVKGRANPEGLDQRQALLMHHGLSKEVLTQKPPRGAGRDDLLDAAVNSLIAERILTGQAEPFPKDFSRDSKGLRAAIWA